MCLGVLSQKILGVNGIKLLNSRLAKTAIKGGD